MSDYINTSYQSNLVSLMSFVHGHKYDANFVFSQSVLLTLVPEDIVRWMTWRVVGDPNIHVKALMKKVEAKEMVCLLRSNTLLQFKKSISWYMPNDSAWNIQAGYGNPTKSKSVNILINAVRKLETGRNGKAALTKRALLMEEFRKLLEVFAEKKISKIRYVP